VDKFDRKTVYLSAFALFGVGTFMCSFAYTYEFMLFARFFTGLFGGLLGGVSTAIISDIIPYERRGIAMAVLNLSFGVASIVGIPFSIFIYKYSDIFWPFRLVGIISFVAFIPAFYFLPSLTGHINKDTRTFHEVKEILKNRNLQKALLFAFLLVLGHFMFISFINPYLIDNLNFKDEDTMWMYIVGGLSVTLTTTRMGKFIDTLGKVKSFRILILFLFYSLFLFYEQKQKCQLWNSYLFVLILSFHKFKSLIIISIISSMLQSSFSKVYP